MVDGMSLHAYYGNTQPLTGNNVDRYLAMNLDMDRQIREIAAVCDYVQGLRKSSKRLWLSFDEWNVWYRARSGAATNGQRQFAPKLLEEVYNLEDALLVGGFLNTLLREFGARARGLPRAARQRHRAARHQRHRRAAPDHLLSVRVGAQVRATAACSICASSRRRIRFAPPACRPTSRATTRCRSSTSSRRSTPRKARPRCSMLNRDTSGEREVVLDWSDITPSRVLACETLTGPDLKAFNTFEQPRKVAPQRLDAPAAGSRMTFKLPAGSYTVAHLAVST